MKNVLENASFVIFCCIFFAFGDAKKCFRDIDGDGGWRFLGGSRECAGNLKWIENG